MAGTSMVTVKRAIFTKLQEVIPDGAKVYYGDPGDGRKDVVWVGDLVLGDIEPTALRAGRRKRDEDYTIYIFVEVTGTGRDVAKSEDRAIELGILVEEMLADDTTVQGSVGTGWAIISGERLVTVTNSDGHRTQLRYEVSVKSRLL